MEYIVEVRVSSNKSKVDEAVLLRTDDIGKAIDRYAQAVRHFSVEEMEDKPFMYHFEDGTCKAVSYLEVELYDTNNIAYSFMSFRF